MILLGGRVGVLSPCDAGQGLVSARLVGCAGRCDAKAHGAALHQKGISGKRSDRLGEVPSVSPSYRNFGGVAALSRVSASHYHSSSSLERSSDSKKREGPRDTESEIASGADESHKDYPFFSQHPKAAADLAAGRAATPESPISPTSAALLPPLPPSRLPVRHCLFQLGSPCRPSICLDQGATRQPTSARCASIITATR